MEKIKKITSFEIDHRTLEPGFYISRIDGDIATCDLRTRKPNCENYMDNVTMHTVEHLFATYIRNSEISDKVIYFGPMGCQTGFYLLVRDVLPEIVFDVVKKVVTLIINHEGEVFGASEIECGNYRTLELSTAKEECKKYLQILNNTKSFSYGG